MKKQLLNFSLIITIIFLIAGCVNIKTQEEASEHENVKYCIEQSIGWAIEKDFDTMYQLWADDMFHFWISSESQIIGLESWIEYSECWKDPDFRGTRFEFKDLRIKFSQSGDVAWYSCFLDDCGSYKGVEFCSKDVVQTGVLEKRNKNWVYVLMHGSYPIDKIPEKYFKKYYSDLFM